MLKLAGIIRTWEIIKRKSLSMLLSLWGKCQAKQCLRNQTQLVNLNICMFRQHIYYYCVCVNIYIYI